MFVRKAQITVGLPDLYQTGLEAIAGGVCSCEPGPEVVGRSVGRAGRDARLQGVMCPSGPADNGHSHLSTLFLTSIRSIREARRRQSSAVGSRWLKISVCCAYLCVCVCVCSCMCVNVSRPTDRQPAKTVV
ncbi:unnamed protein product [Protopolystoma xenopodis]|uniref:Uncharacterized protein n=1 Tax=Protopolystoma xenopodis TaxID=117903 RepID=A0A448XFV2_9PLAT|nr:unnamed protein product [Protopolystoma xenopodis]